LQYLSIFSSKLRLSQPAGASWFLMLWFLPGATRHGIGAKSRRLFGLRTPFAGAFLFVGIVVIP